MARVGPRPLALLLLAALASPWGFALGTAVHVIVEHGHDHGPSGGVASLEHGHEHALGTPHHDHFWIPSARSSVKAAPAAWACALAPDRLLDDGVQPRRLTVAHPPPWSARLLPGDLLRI